MQRIEFRCNHTHRSSKIKVCFRGIKGQSLKKLKKKHSHHTWLSTKIDDYFQYFGTVEDSNRLINMERSAEVFNEVLRLYKQETPDCAGLFTWDMATEERHRFGTRLAMRCKICTYVSKQYNLYKEVSPQSPGRKAATVNYGIQVGLSQTSLGNNGLKKILASANTSPPSRKSLQKTSNIVMARVGKLNEADMSRRGCQLVDINRLRGSKYLHTASLYSVAYTTWRDAVPAVDTNYVFFC